MTNNLPDYTTIEPPDGKSVDDYTTHERRADILHRLAEAGSPFAIKQVRLAERYGVAESTISRDMDRIRESVDSQLGADAKLTTRLLLEKTVRELHAEGEWKAAWDVAMDWNSWLADIGEQHREPQKSSHDVEMRSRNVDVAYTVVREGDDEPHPTPTGSGGDDSVAPDGLGFTSSPVTIDVDSERDGDE